MSNVPFTPEQDVGGDDNLPTYENLEQAHGPNSRYAQSRPHPPRLTFDLVLKVRSVEKLGRKEVSACPSTYRVAKVTTVRAAERYADVTPEEWERRKQRGWGDGIAEEVYTTWLSFHHVVSRFNHLICTGCTGRGFLDLKTFHFYYPDTQTKYRP